MSKRKYTAEEKLQICIDKNENGLSNSQLALKYSIAKTTIRDWVNAYEKSGPDAFRKTSDNKKNSYTADFRIGVVKEKLNSDVSYSELGRKYGINKSVIQQWVYKYNEKGESALTTDYRGISAKGRPPKNAAKTTIKRKDRKTIDKQLLDELEALRAEVAYLKKFNALVQEKQKLQKKKKL